MTVASRTRAAAREHPFVVDALRAGVCNYAAAARFLDVADDEDAVATALRRYGADLPDYRTEAREVRVSMESGLGLVESSGGREALLATGGVSLAADAGSLTAVLATGDVDAAALRAVLGGCATADCGVVAAGVGGESLVVAVDRRDGPAALRAVEDALERVPGGSSTV